ncbi:diamine acetyltransferase 1-like isoform X3 [Lytechinus variegatus]|uniref:diamine acetyltransferase 1-like isoform X3 n=1 Tax=Lytechinus variegatus TaxID=7654 RepID=UPI001BB2BCBE|nr:diamine acetyltransferase 1-like isoform X3 [Lytechinus variegatus]
MASYTIRKGRIEDCDALFELAMKLRVHTGDSVFGGPVTTEEMLREDGFGPLPRYRFYLAIYSPPENGPKTTEKEKAVGFAGLSDMFCPLSGRTSYLTGLFVDAEHRGNHLGVALMKAVAQDCVKQRSSRLSFAVDTNDLNTRKFYAAIGATNLTESTCPNEYWRFFEPNIRKLATGDELKSSCGKTIAFKTD